MHTPFKFAFKLLAALGVGSFASLAAAGGTSSGAVIITYGPVGTAAAIPTISGSLLIALAVLLVLVAFRLLKDRPHSSTNLLIAAAAIAALATGAGGIKLVADANAAALEAAMTDPNGGTLELGVDGLWRVVNSTEVPQEIKTLERFCAGNGGAPQVQALNGGSEGTCSTSTTLIPAAYCEIFVGCS